MESEGEALKDNESLQEGFMGIKRILLRYSLEAM
jgi:hypothetical protein